MSRGAPAALLLLSLLVLFGYPAQAQEPEQAGLVVAFGDGQTETFCIELDEPEISGYELLARAGLEIEVSDVGMGAALCRVGDTGCPAGDCFCECRGAECEYWSYWHLNSDTWEYSAVGATLYRIEAGSVDGWTWGPGSVTEAVEPPLMTLEEICAAPGQSGVAVSARADGPATDQHDDVEPYPASVEAGSTARGSLLTYLAVAGVVVTGLFLWLLARRKGLESA